MTGSLYIHASCNMRILFPQDTHLALRTSAKIDLPRRGYSIFVYRAG